MPQPTPKPVSPFEILGTLLVTSVFLAVVTKWIFFGVVCLILAPFTLLAFGIWAFSGPFYNPFDTD